MNNQKQLKNYENIQMSQPPPSYSEIYQDNTNNSLTTPDFYVNNKQSFFKRNLIHFIIAFSMLFLAPLAFFLLLIRFFILL